MPKHNDLLVQVIFQSIMHVPVAIGPRKNDYAKLHVSELRYKVNKEGAKPEASKTKSGNVIDDDCQPETDPVQDQRQGFFIREKIGCGMKCREWHGRDNPVFIRVF